MMEYSTLKKERLINTQTILNLLLRRASKVPQIIFKNGYHLMGLLKTHLKRNLKEKYSQYPFKI
jgi:hypothetical protein